MSKFVKLGAALDKQNFEWLQSDNEDVAAAVAAEIAAGGEPDAIGRYVASQIGETRAGYVNRIKSAARWLKSRVEA
jgi:hypothetical protein